MKQVFEFFSNTAANLLALFVFFFLVPLAVLVSVVCGVLRSGVLTVSENCDYSALVLDMSSPVSEFPRSDDAVYNYIKGGAWLSTHSLCAKIDSAAGDDSNSLIFLTGSFGADVSYAQIAEIRAALQRYAKSGKTVVAYLENPSTRDYFLASAATTVVLNPFSEVQFAGLGGNAMFFGNALKKYGVDATVVKVGRLKSFGEMFTSDKMSAPVRENYAALLESVWSSVISKVAASRKIVPDKLREIADTRAVLSADEAKSLGLVDKLMYRDQVIDMISERVGCDGITFSQTPISSYPETFAENADGAVALVYMRGEILDSPASDGVIDSASYSVLLRELRFDETVSAVVLRIDSGGGSAFASESIRRGVELLAADKPVVVSVGGSAASGAYWIASAANKIFADSESITGSIGVFSILFSAEKLAGDFGITFDGVKTSPMADAGTIARKPTKTEIDRVQRLTDRVYEKFVSLVAKSRKMKPERVAEIADGCVFSGADAVRVGLVDGIRPLSECVEFAAKAAKLKSFEVWEYPQRNAIAEFVSSFTDGNVPFAKAFRAVFNARKIGNIMSAKSGVYARSPFDFVVE